MRISKKNLPRDDPKLGMVLSEYADSLRKAGQEAEAARVGARAEQIRDAAAQNRKN